MSNYKLQDKDFVGCVAFLVMVAAICIYTSSISRDRVRQAQHEEYVLDTTEASREIVAEPFKAVRYVACDKGYGRSWRRWTGSHEALVTVTRVRIVYQSGRIWEGEEHTGGPPYTIRCSWRNPGE